MWILQLITVLKYKPYKTYHYLAEFLEVSGCTAYCWLDLLKAVGIKVSKWYDFTSSIPGYYGDGLEFQLLKVKSQQYSAAASSGIRRFKKYFLGWRMPTNDL